MIFKILRSPPKTIINRFLTAGFESVVQSQGEGYAARGKLVLIVPLRYKFKQRSPRDADTAKSLFLVIYYVPAVCELLVSLREREFVPPIAPQKINTIHK